MARVITRTNDPRIIVGTKASRDKRGIPAAQILDQRHTQQTPEITRVITSRTRDGPQRIPVRDFIDSKKVDCQ